MKAVPMRAARRARTVSRSLNVEMLEERRLLAAASPLADVAETPWHNGTYRLDVNNDSSVTTDDLLAIVNKVLRDGYGELPSTPPDPVTLYYDTTGDNRLTASDLISVINGILAPPEVTLSMFTPFTVDLTPEVTVVATPQGNATLPDGTPVDLDVDLNNDGDFNDLGERSQTESVLYQGQARFSLNPGLLPTPDLYDVRLRARVRNSEAVEGASTPLTLQVDNRTSSALKDYVNAPSTFSWEEQAPPKYGTSATPYAYYVLQMTSQVWRSAADVNLPEWHHWMEIYVPTDDVGNVVAVNSTSLLFIRGGSNTSNAPNQPDATMAQIATETQSVVTVLRDVPSEPLIFTDETQPREEDEIISYTLDKYLGHIGDPGNETWPLLLPMVKSAVRAMDTVQTFITYLDENQHIDNFFVSGESKRGWTTWLTAATDDRVRGIIPGVFDNLDQAAQMVNHYGVLGKFSEEVRDYTNFQIFERILTPEAQLLGKIVDPYSYLRNGRFDNMPKLILNSAGDEFFVPDSSRFYFQDLPGDQNYLRYIPNTGHGLDERAVSSRRTFYDAILNDRPLPKYSWTVDQDGSIHVQTDTQPLEVRLWQATNPVARDFRHGYNPSVIWTSTLLDSTTPGSYTYVGNVDTPPSGATAYLVELTFPNSVPGADPYVFTTEARIKSPIPLAAWPYATGLVADPSATALVESEVASPATTPSVATDEGSRNAVAVALGQTTSSTVAFQAAANPFVDLPAAPVSSTVSMSPSMLLEVPSGDESLAIEPNAGPDANLVDHLLDSTLDELLA